MVEIAKDVRVQVARARISDLVNKPQPGASGTCRQRHRAAAFWASCSRSELRPDVTMAAAEG